ncbi:MAG: hypothetical protein P8Y83_01905 [Gammaproteobacteria bacterium]|jgi:hypothetical protein
MHSLTVTSRDPAIVAQVRIRCSSDPWASEQLSIARGDFFTAMRIMFAPDSLARREIALAFFNRRYPEQQGRASLCAGYALHHARTIALRGECWFVDHRDIVRFARLDFPDYHSTPFRPLFMLTT